MLANRVRMSSSKKSNIPDYYEMAADRDFLGVADGEFRYVGFHEYVIIPHTIKGVPVTSYREMFTENMSSALTGVASDNSNVTDMSVMFFGLDYLYPTLDLSSLDTSNVTDMSGMFIMCMSLISLDLSSFDTSNVTNMNLMFKDCFSLEFLDLSSFDTSKVTSMDYMFDGCYGLRTAYARTQKDADRFNASIGKPSNVNFTVKG